MTNHAAPTLFGTARDKAELYLERYTILHQVSWEWENISKLGRKKSFGKSQGYLKDSFLYIKVGHSRLCLVSPIHYPNT